ncbi:MAG TPA: hypothetical protein VII99_06075 [Bacteroidia bacterium]
MKSFRIIFLFGAIMAIFSTCGTYTPPVPEHFSSVKYTLINHSKYFSDCIRNVEVDTGNQKLRIRFNLRTAARFPFPVIDSMKDTLTGTAFRVEFLHNGQPILLDRAVIFPSFNAMPVNYYWRGKSLDSVLSFSSDTVDLRNSSALQFTIPFYAFQQLKSGRQKIELKVSQNIFCSAKEISIREWNPIFHDTSFRYMKNYKAGEMISCKIALDLNVPPIYKSILYGEGLMLRNDSTFSPAGMDNTIWNSSYPDIYWLVYSPKEMYYAKTDFEKSTDTYVGKDTFNIYHYHPNDTIGIGVYDHDWLSPDDWLGDCRVSLKDLQGNYSQELHFDHVKWFCVYAKTIGIINK